MMKLRKGDMVVVLSGNYRGQGPAKVSAIGVDFKRVFLEGIGNALKHVKRGHSKSPQGGRVSVPISIDVSNVAPHCQNCNSAVRLKILFVDGGKVRTCCKCKKSL